MAKRVGVLLSGCGVMDGTEIQEAVLAMLALDQADAEIICCAPNDKQPDVVDHLSGDPTPETRNMLVEAARIARGQIRDLEDVHAKDLDAVILPGGYGAVKNLSTYACQGPTGALHPQVERLLREFAQAGKPIGAICMAPVVAAQVFKGLGRQVSVTVGNDPDTSRDLASMGAEHVECPVGEIVVDRKNKVVSTPAYMLAKGPAEVYTGVKKLVEAVLGLCESRS